MCKLNNYIIQHGINWQMNTKLFGFDTYTIFKSSGNIFKLKIVCNFVAILVQGLDS